MLCINIRTANHWSCLKRSRIEAGKSSSSILDWQSLGPWLKEAEGRLVSLEVASSATDHWILVSEKQEGGQLV